MKFKNYIETESGIKDTSTSPGTAGQLLSSTVAGTSWIDQNTISSGTSEVVDIQVKNISSANGGINLSKGDPVYIYGSVGASARLYVDLADADSTATNNLGDGKMPCVGLLDQDLSPNGEGTATVVGKLRNLITNPIDGDVPNENDTVYVKSGGGLTLTKPTGSTNLIQNVGQVGRVSTSSDGNIVVAALLRSNDVPNLPEGRIWIGDGNTIVSDTVYVDEPNNRVGIGTTTPSTDLEVSSTGVNGIVISKTSNQSFVSGRLFFTTDTLAEGFALFNSNGTLQINSAAVPNDTSGNNKISIIGSTGNVGIGTTTPTSRLHSVTTQSGPVDYTNRAAILGINNSTDTLYANSVGVAGKVSTSGGFAIYGDASLAGGWAGYFDGKGYFSGNVGIGTGFPTQKLHVNGNARLTGLFYDGTNSGGTAGQILSSDGGQTEWIDGSAIPGVPAGSGTINYLARWTPDANTLGIGVTYDNGTSVGIGTTSPGAYKLAVAGSTAIGENLEVSDGLGGDKTLSIDATVGTFQIGDIDGIGDEAYVEGDSSSIKIFTGGSETLVCDNNQRVGIGTNIPQAKLHVANGTLRTWTPTSGTSAIFESTVSNRNFLTLTAANQAELWFGDATTQAKGRIRYVISDGLLNLEDMEFWTNSTQQMIINFQGDVGIGTDAPNERMHVRGSGGVRLEVEATDSTVAALKLTNTAGSYGSFVNASGSLSVYDYNANDTRTTLLANGNFGIGTTDPTAKLHVVQSTAANGEAALHLIGPSSNPALTSSVLIIEQGDGKKITIDGNDIDVSSGDLFINDYSKEDVTFGGQIKVKGLGSPVGDSYISNGNFGIGTTQPNAKLEIAGSSSSGKFLLIDNVGSGGTFLNVEDGVGSQLLQIKRETGNTISFNSFNDFNFIGNVGIGATDPLHPLDVNGEIHSSTYVSATAGLGVDNTIGTLGRGISLYNGPVLYPQYGLLFAQTVDLGTYGGVSGDWATYMTMSGTATRGWIWKAGPTNSTAGNVASISGVGQLTLASTATATNFILSSDKTLKDNIKEIDTKHVDVDWKNFELKSEPGIKRAGVIAQELEIKHPEFVRTADDGLKSVAYIDLLITKIAELEARLEKLEK